MSLTRQARPRDPDAFPILQLFLLGTCNILDHHTALGNTMARIFT